MAPTSSGGTGVGRGSSEETCAGTTVGGGGAGVTGRGTGRSAGAGEIAGTEDTGTVLGFPEEHPISRTVRLRATTKRQIKKNSLMFRFQAPENRGQLKRRT